MEASCYFSQIPPTGTCVLFFVIHTKPSRYTYTIYTSCRSDTLSRVTYQDVPVYKVPHTLVMLNFGRYTFENSPHCLLTDIRIIGLVQIPWYTAVCSLQKLRLRLFWCSWMHARLLDVREINVKGLKHRTFQDDINKHTHAYKRIFFFIYFSFSNIGERNYLLKWFLAHLTEINTSYHTVSMNEILYG